MQGIPHYIQENFDISFLSAFKTHAKARYYFEITTHDDILLLPEIFWFSEEHSIPLFMIAGGTNCLFAFDTYEGIIIRNRYAGYSEPYGDGEKNFIRVHSGEVTTNLAIKLYQSYSISTLVPWVGLPGTLGGACIGNAGCFGLEMADLFVEARVLDMNTGEISLYKKSDMGYQYRESVLKEDKTQFVIDMVLDISPKGGTYESYTPSNLQSLRKLKQPPGFSCGSFFKNPKIEEFHTFIGGNEDLIGERGHTESLSAGMLIDKAGLKGSRVGGVHVSERHGNFFINDQKGTWKDILELRDIVKEGVKKKYDIELHEEVRIISQPT
ncbi:MAG: UDP-N-acetylmuramate dehydrogenase [Candidatus Altimarinota bacterium]